VEGGDVYDEQKRGDGGSLRDPTETGAKEGGDPWNVWSQDDRLLSNILSRVKKCKRFGITPPFRAVVPTPRQSISLFILPSFSIDNLKIERL